MESSRDHVVPMTETLNRDAARTAQHIALSLTTGRQTSSICINFTTSVGGRPGPHPCSNEAREALTATCAQGTIKWASALPFTISAGRSGLAGPAFPTWFKSLSTLSRPTRRHGLGIIGMKPPGEGLPNLVDLCMNFLQQYPHVEPIPDLLLGSPAFYRELARENE